MADEKVSYYIPEGTSFPVKRVGEQAGVEDTVSPEAAAKVWEGIAKEKAGEAAAAKIPAPIRAAMGFGGGATANIAPAAFMRLMGHTPETWDALKETTAYGAGSAAALAAQAIASAGAGGARSGARALASGIPGVEATVENAILGRFLPRASSMLGESLTKVGARAGAASVGGALYGIGNQFAEDVAHNAPLALENYAAAGLKGAAISGAIGGTLALAGVAGKGAAKAIGKATIGSSAAAAEARVVRELGLTKGQVRRGVQQYGSVGNMLKSMRGELEAAGENWASKPDVRFNVHKKAYDNLLKVRADGLKELGSPVRVGEIAHDRIADSLRKEIVAPLAGTMEAGQAAAYVEKQIAQLAPIRDAKSFEQLFRTVDQAVSMAGKKELEVSASNIIQNEIRTMTTDAAARAGKEAIGESIAKANAGLYANRVAMEAASEQIGKAALQAPGGKGGVLSSALTTAGFAALNSPVAAGMWGIRTGLAAGVLGKFQGHIAEMSWKSAYGASLAAGGVAAKARIGGSVGQFFGKAAAASSRFGRGGLALSAPVRQTRASFDEAALKTSEIASGRPFDAMVAQAGVAASDEQIAALQKTYELATRMLQHHLPSPRGGGGLSLKEVTNPKGLSAKESKFLRVFGAVTDPMAVIDKIASGDVTRTEMAAVKYVYPSIHATVVAAAAEHVTEMKAKGESLPMDKVTKLGIILDAPVDTTLEKDFISAIQSTMAAPAKPGPSPQPKPFDQTSLMTPTDKGIYR